jgi:hypothetical protein
MKGITEKIAYEERCKKTLLLLEFASTASTSTAAPVLPPSAPLVPTPQDPPVASSSRVRTGLPESGREDRE